MQTIWDLLPANLWPTQSFIPPDEAARTLQALQALQAPANSLSPATNAPDDLMGARWSRAPVPVGPANDSDLYAALAGTRPRVVTNLASADTSPPGGILGTIFGETAAPQAAPSFWDQLPPTQPGRPFVPVMPTPAQLEHYFPPAVRASPVTPGAQVFFPDADPSTDKSALLALGLGGDQSLATQQLAAGATRQVTDDTVRSRRRAINAQIAREPRNDPAGWSVPPPEDLVYEPPSAAQLGREWGQVAKGFAKGIPASAIGLGLAGDIESMIRAPFREASGQAAFAPGATFFPTSLEGGYFGPRGLGWMAPPQTPEEAGGMMLGSMVGPGWALKAPRAIAALRGAAAVRAARAAATPATVVPPAATSTRDLAQAGAADSPRVFDQIGESGADIGGQAASSAVPSVGGIGSRIARASGEPDQLWLPNLPEPRWVVRGSSGQRISPRQSPVSTLDLQARQSASATAPTPIVGPSDIAEWRMQNNVPTRDTVAIARTDLPGLENAIFEGGSPLVRDEAGLPPAIPHPIESLFKHPRSRGHGEEDIGNQVLRKVNDLDLPPADMLGSELWIHLSKPSCPWCRSGIGTSATPGVLKQLSNNLPGVMIHVSSDAKNGTSMIGPTHFSILDGDYVKRSKR